MCSFKVKNKKKKGQGFFLYNQLFLDVCKLGSECVGMDFPGVRACEYNKVQTAVTWVGLDEWGPDKPAGVSPVGPHSPHWTIEGGMGLQPPPEGESSSPPHPSLPHCVLTSSPLTPPPHALQPQCVFPPLPSSTRKHRSPKSPHTRDNTHSHVYIIYIYKYIYCT